MNTLTFIRNHLFPSMPQEITFIRHGQSSRNLGLEGRLFFQTEQERSIYGNEADPDVPLSTIGSEQAKLRGRHLQYSRELRPDIVIHTGFRRTVETAQLILEQIEGSETTSFIEHAGFRERKTGYGEIALEQEFKNYFPWGEQYFKHNGRYMANPINGESLISMREGRIRNAIKDMEIYRGKRVLIVSHGRTMMCAHMELMKFDLRTSRDFCEREESAPSNCSMSRYIYDPSTGNMSCLCYAEVLEE